MDLIVTNHHCVHPALQLNATPDNNIVENYARERKRSCEIEAFCTIRDRWIIRSWPAPSESPMATPMGAKIPTGVSSWETSGRSMPSTAVCVCALRAEPAFLRAYLVVELVEEAKADQAVDVVAGREIEHVNAVVRNDEAEG